MALGEIGWDCSMLYLVLDLLIKSLYGHRRRRRYQNRLKAIPLPRSTNKILSVYDQILQFWPISQTAKTYKDCSGSFRTWSFFHRKILPFLGFFFKFLLHRSFITIAGSFATSKKLYEETLCRRTNNRKVFLLYHSKY